MDFEVAVGFSSAGFSLRFWAKQGQTPQAEARATAGLHDWTRGAGPGPVFGVLDQASCYGISFDVGADFLPFAGIANPVVEGFDLPGLFAGTAQNEVGFAGGGAFDLLSNLGEPRLRLDQDVNMICHEGVRVQLIKLAQVQFAEPRNDAFGDARVFQPERATESAVQNAVALYKGLTG